MQPQLTPPEAPRPRALLITSAQRAIPSLPARRREDDLELRKVPALPPASSIDPDRPTVVVIDDALLMGVDEPMIEQLSKRAALVGIADNHEALLEEGWAHHRAAEIRREGGRAAARWRTVRTVVGTWREAGEAS